MKKWEQQPPQSSLSHRRGRNNPSFSSSLLDAIYSSIDDSNAGTKSFSPINTDKNLAQPPRPPVIYSCTRDPAVNHRHRRLFSVANSSDSSKFSGISSNSKSTTRPLHDFTRYDLIRTDQPPPPESKKPSGSIRSRFGDVRKPPAPASPGARLAAIFNSIFSGSSGGSTKRSMLTSNVGDPANTSSSFYSSWGTSKAAKSYKGCGKQETVRFSPAYIGAAENLKPTRVRGGGDPPEAVDRPRIELLRRFQKTDDLHPTCPRNGGGLPELRDRRRMEMLRRLHKTEDLEDCDSVSSSDLFELESLPAIGRFKDELPVYETTNRVGGKATPRGFIV